MWWFVHLQHFHFSDIFAKNTYFLMFLFKLTLYLKILCKKYQLKFNRKVSSFHRIVFIVLMSNISKLRETGSSSIRKWARVIAKSKQPAKDMKHIFLLLWFKSLIFSSHQFAHEYGISRGAMYSLSFIVVNSIRIISVCTKNWTN